MTEPQTPTSSATAPADILAVHAGALGDVVMLGQMLDHLRGEGATVRLASGGAKANLLAALGVVDQTLDFDLLAMQELFAEQPPARPTLPAALGGGRWLISCFAEGNLTAAARLAAWSGAERVNFLPVRPAECEPRHLLDQWAKQLGVEPLTSPRPWEAPQPLRERARGLLQRLGFDPSQRFVTIGVGAGGDRKCRPPSELLAVARSLDVPAVFVLGPVEVERWGASLGQMLAQGGWVVIDPTLAELAGLLSISAGHLGFDTGPTHLAAALGRPTVAWFVSTDPARFAPRGRWVRWVDQAEPAAAKLAEAIKTAP